jgi:putative endonuclease
MLNRHYLGIIGEAIAKEFLIRRRYTILATRWTYKRLEIDIIAQFEDILVFVEVKTRKANPFGLPDEGLSEDQASRIVVAAQAYIDKENWNRYWQFDLIAIEWKGGGNYLLRHLTDLPF